ncbi:UDP-glucose 6-dehydrogenase 2-like [Triticum aestivum]|uniref:UDP-glucose 6-dehydrogenase 2-like n=1 Tax=Triticum aestivum TaxID=4565 RepID=UPI001D015792|nr:UDP-glucose 6-dehydrogenase 2-like [Triticum aestivum]
MDKFDWDHPRHLQPVGEPAGQPVAVTSDAYEAARVSHAVCILIEWEEFTSLGYRRVHDVMQKPAYVLDSRNILDLEKLEDIGFIFYAIGKLLDQ